MMFKTKDFAKRPCLERTPSRSERRLRIGDLGDVMKPLEVQTFETEI